MILDRSGSIDQADYALVKRFMSDIILDTNVDTGEAQVGLIAFSDEADIIFHVSYSSIGWLVSFLCLEGDKSV